MIQSSLDFFENIEKINKFESPCYLQKIYSSSRLLCLTARFQGKTCFLYLGRGHGVEGFWVADDKIRVELRRIDRFLEYLRKYLSSVELLSVERVFYDRCLHLVYRRYGRKSSFIFFWKGRKLYFMNYFFDPKINKFCIMRSWRNKEFCDQELPSCKLKELFFEIGLRKEETSKGKKPQSSIKLILQNEKLALIKKNKSHRKKKFLERKLNRIRSDLKSVEDACELQDKMISDKIDFVKMGKVLQFKSLVIKFNSEVGAYAKRERAFQKVKSYKKAWGILKEREQAAKNEIKLMAYDFVDQFEKKLKIIQPHWIIYDKALRSKKDVLTKKRIKVYRTKNGLSFSLGLDSAGNDYLRSKWGHLDDLWFHLDGYQGAHLVVKEKNIGNIDIQSLQIVISALADYSRLNIGEIPVIFTAVKNLRGVRGSRGKVVYKKTKHIKVLYDEDWKNKVEQD